MSDAGSGTALEAAVAGGMVVGPPSIVSIEKGPTIACHNLVVADDHTFFVGASRVLVHDKTCPEPLALAK